MNKETIKKRNTFVYKIIIIIFIMFTSYILFLSSVSAADSFTSSDGLHIVYTFYEKDPSINETAGLIVVSDTFFGKREEIVDFANWWNKKGFFVINLDTRGKGDSEGSHDIAGYACRDVYESIQDVLNEKKASYNITSDLPFYITGLSGGGGRALTCSAKYPDLFSGVVSFYGIANYSLWYDNGEGDKPNLESFLNGNPETVPNAYKSVSGTYLAENYISPIQIQHNPGDSSVSIVNAREFNNTLSSLNKTFEYLEETDLDHGFNAGENHKINASDFFKNNTEKLFINEYGKFKISGFLVTKNFSITLGNVFQLGIIEYNLSLNYFNLTLENNVSYNFTYFDSENYTLIVNTLNNITIGDDKKYTPKVEEPENSGYSGSGSGGGGSSYTKNKATKNESNNTNIMNVEVNVFLNNTLNNNTLVNETGESGVSEKKITGLAIDEKHDNNFILKIISWIKSVFGF